MNQTGGSPCPVCKSRRRPEIDRWIIGGNKTDRELGRLFGLRWTSIKSHRVRHVRHDPEQREVS